LAVFEHVQRIAADVFAVPVNHIILDSSPASIEKWDSLQHLNLVLALEGEFGVQFAPEEIEQLLSIESITAVLDQKLHAAGRML
jgi:acyl carrier protein